MNNQDFHFRLRKLRTPGGERWTVGRVAETIYLSRLRSHNSSTYLRMCATLLFGGNFKPRFEAGLDVSPLEKDAGAPPFPDFEKRNFAITHPSLDGFGGHAQSAGDFRLEQIAVRGVRLVLCNCFHVTLL